MRQSECLWSKEVLKKESMTLYFYLICRSAKLPCECFPCFIFGRDHVLP